MSKKLILTITAVIAVIVIVVTGLFLLPKEKESPGSATPAPASTEPATTLPDPTPIPEDELEVDKSIPESELKLASQIFTNAEATESFTKEQVQIAEMTAYDYFNTALGNTYFADGSFERDGYPTEKFDQWFAKYFDYRTLGDIHQKLNDRTTLDSATGTPIYIANLQNMLWFLQLNGGAPETWLTEACRTGGITQEGDVNMVTSSDSPCFVDYPTISDMTYREVTTESGINGIVVTATGVTKPVIVNNGVEGFKTVTFKFEVLLTPNEHPDWENGVHSMLIRGFTPAAPVSTAWEPLT